MVNTENATNIIMGERPSELGAPPGILHLPENASPPRIDVTIYNADSFERRTITSVNELAELDLNGKQLWVDVNGLGDPTVIDQLGQHFGFHRLSLEDVVHTPQRPKMEAYDDHLFFVTQMPAFEGSVAFEQISLFLGTSFVVTFQSTPKNMLGPIVSRLEHAVGRIRTSSVDYLAYAIIDMITDAYFPVLEHFDQAVDALEDEIMNSPKPAVVERIYKMKRELLAVRRAAWGMREALSGMTHEDLKLIADATVYYLRDTYDHSIRIVEIAEQYRELASGLMDWYQSCLSQRMNEVMKTLTIISTIFIPLTFIAGIYGMNFDPEASRWNMPELRLPYGYVAVWAAMLVSVFMMYLFFRRRGWLGGNT
ncbi:MAG: magnesium transporter [Candidatus Promineifilaceae bacterium]|jgi:magnesium transporter